MDNDEEILKQQFISEEVGNIGVDIYFLTEEFDEKISELKKDIEAFETGNAERLNKILLNYKKQQFDRIPKRLRSKPMIEKRDMIMEETNEKVSKFVKYFGVNGIRKLQFDETP